MSKSNFIVRGGANFNPLYNEFNKAQKQMNSFKSTMTKTMKGLGIALSGLAIGKVVKDSLNAASELEGAFVGLESILTGQGKSFDKAKGFIDDYISDGLIPLTNAITAYKNLAARGYSDDQIQTTLERLKDAAAFGRQASYSLGEAVSSATEGLKNENSILVDNAGVTKNVSKMWDDYAKSIGKNRNQLTQQEKIQAEVNGIMQETQWQVGDAAKYTDTYAGRVAALGKTLRDIKINLGQAFMPIANVVVPLLQTLANSLSRVTSVFAQFTQTLFGKANIQKQAKETMQQATSIEELGDATEKAGKQAKGAIAGFDEINNLSMNEGGAGTSGGGTSVGTSEVIDDGTGGVMEEVATKASEMAEKLKTAFKDINFDNIKNALGNLKVAMEPLTTTLFEGLYWAVNNIFLPLARITIESVIPFFLNALALAMKGLNVVLEKAKPIIIGVGTAFIGWKAIEFANYVKYIGALTNTTGFVALLNAVKQLAFVGFAGLKPKLVELLTPMKTLALNLLTGAKNAGLLLIEMLKQTAALVTNAAAWVWQKVVLVASTVAQVAMTAATAAWNVIATIATTVTTALGAAIAFLTSPIGLVIIAITALVAGIVLLVKNWDKVKIDGSNAWEGIKSAWNKASEWFDKNIIEPISKGFKGLFNSIISGMNWLIRGLNKISIDMPDWVPVVGGKKFGISIAEIPKLAKGGITNGPMIAMVGDNPGGREVVSPLDDLMGMIASAVGSGMLGAMQFNSGSSNNEREIILEIDGTKIGRAILPKLDQESERLGYKSILQVE